MKKLFLPFFFLIIICLPVLLSSCTTECTHDYLSSTTVAPTCGEEGYTLNVCTECGSEFKTNYKLPTGHELTETVFEPTCRDEGYTYYACSCGYSYRSEALPPSGHTYKETTVAATCTEAGYTEYLCVDCSHSYRADYSTATGHDMAKTVCTPTESSVGYTEYKCSVCGESYKTDFKFYSDMVGGGHVRTSTVLSRGIDVSYYQNADKDANGYTVYNPLNWQAIKNAGVEFAILRAGYTGSESHAPTKDIVFEMNYADARAAGVMLGAYYYTRATSEEMLDEEIDALLGWLEGKKFEYPIYFDIEAESLIPLGKDTLTKLCLRFVSRMRESGYYGAVYTNQNWLDEYLHGEAVESYCDVWYAHYTVSGKDKTVEFDDAFSWSVDKYGEQLSMWQYTDCGIFAGCGIAAKVDLNYSYKDYPSIIKTYGFNGYEAEISTLSV